MREILFRARRIDNGEWVEGYYIYHIKRTICPIGDSVKPEDEQHVIMQDGFSDWNMPRNTVVFDIDPETVCQYTGLKDKNGDQIWENDIVSCEHEKYPDDNPSEVYPLLPESIKYTRNYAVEFINTGSSYGYRLRNKSIHFMLTGNVIQNHKIEVVGNIFDNPELLKGE